MMQTRAVVSSWYHCLKISVLVVLDLLVECCIQLWNFRYFI